MQEITRKEQENEASYGIKAEELEKLGQGRREGTTLHPKSTYSVEIQKILLFIKKTTKECMHKNFLRVGGY